MESIRVIVLPLLKYLGAEYVFRSNIILKAKRLNIKGFSQDFTDGTTEIIAVGKSASINKFIDLLQSDPLLARILYLEKNIKIQENFKSFEHCSDVTPFPQTKYLIFQNKNGTVFIAKSAKQFIKAFISCDNDDWLATRLNDGYFERWLYNNEYIELYNLISGAKIVDITNIADRMKQVNTIKSRLKSRQYFKSIKLETILEAHFKEYETLRAEIIASQENRTQIIFLGITGVFAIAGLAIAPLTDFFTREKIVVNFDLDQIPQRISEGLIDGTTTIDPNGIPHGVIARYIDGTTINDQAIYPSIIILAFIIPLICLYIIFRISRQTTTISSIGKYISVNIENKIERIISKKIENDIFYRQLSNDDCFLYSSDKLPEIFRERCFLNWERMTVTLRSSNKNTNRTIVNFVILFFMIVIIVSIIVSFWLASRDFTSSGFRLNIAGIIIIIVCCAIHGVTTVLFWEYLFPDYLLDKSKPNKVLFNLMLAKGTRYEDLVGVFRSKKELLKVLDGDQNITRDEADKLGKYFKVSGDLFKK